MDLANGQTLLFPAEPKTSTPQAENTCFAEVLLLLSTGKLEQPIYTYAVPELFEADIAVGVPVLVPFGGQQNVTGFVVGLPESPPAGVRLREITELLDHRPLFDAQYLDFLKWVGEYYATPLHQVLSCALPANLIQKNRKLVKLTAYASHPGVKMDPLAARLVRTLGNKAYSPKFLASQLKMPLKSLQAQLALMTKQGILETQQELSDSTQDKRIRMVRCNPDFCQMETLSSRQRELMASLREAKEPLSWQECQDRLSTTPATLQKLASAGAILIEEQTITRDPLAYYQTRQQEQPLNLTPAQLQAVQRVLDGEPVDPYLLFGVTGSGKTEVYLELTRRVLETGKSVLVMVPEIALTSQIARRFIRCFGKENIALWHSNLSAGEKADTWRRLQSGELKILIGARSGIWAPIKDLGQIIIDEEHDNSFKQDSPAPRYHTQVLAIELTRRTGAKLMIGSATPDLASYYAALKANTLLKLPERFGSGNMAKVELVDMRTEREQGNQMHLSRALLAELQENVARGEQSILLINRRGFYTTIQCVLCDHVFTCPNCDVAVTYHRTHNSVCCHYCGHEADRPQFCPVCASMELTHRGVGTQRIEEEVLNQLPDARVLRLDSDVLQTKHAYREIFEAFNNGEADILIGTQMVSKGLDNHNVTLVGVISADASFALPDYKSMERGFQLLTQVAGRAGRGSLQGRVILQAANTQHKVLELSVQQDYEAFYEYEMEMRQALSFPPFSQLFRFIVSSENEAQARQYIETAAHHLRAYLSDRKLADVAQFLGPAPCVLPRIQGRYRFNLLFKNLAGAAGHEAVTSFYRKALIPEGVNFLLDIDAQSLL